MKRTRKKAASKIESPEISRENMEFINGLSAVVGSISKSISRTKKSTGRSSIDIQTKDQNSTIKDIIWLDEDPMKFVSNNGYEFTGTDGYLSADMKIVAKGGIDALSSRIENVDDPENDLDAANKRYVDQASGGISSLIEPITWEALKELKDNSSLVPGQQYRITDYVATTIQEYTQSAGHQFDIIVIADSVDKLNENARAIIHDGDLPDDVVSENTRTKYFANSNLAVWKLKYCLDNDTTRFWWADSTNGKGVVYWMKDEWDNECPYDFKGIQFARWKLSNGVGYIYDADSYEWIEDTDGKLDAFLGVREGLYATPNSDSSFLFGYNDNIGGYRYKVKYAISQNPTHVFTFGVSDFSTTGKNIISNIIKPYYFNTGKLGLNNVVLLNLNTQSICRFNTFGDNCSYNTFGDNCSYNTFGDFCSYNTFGDNCSSNTFGDFCSSNTFGWGCAENTFGWGCAENTFGDSCQSNTFGDSCQSNTFGDSCQSNTFGDNCSSNTFGDFCSYNTFGDNCQFNAFGDNCSYNTFGDFCSYNTFGDNCQFNAFGGDCFSNTFGSDPSMPQSYFQYITFELGVNNVNLYYSGSETLDYDHMILNITVSKGVASTQINISDVNQNYKTTYQMPGSQTITITTA